MGRFCEWILIGRVSSKEILVSFVSLWAFGNATLLNPYTYNKDKRGVCMFVCFFFPFWWKFFLLHLVPLLDEFFVDYLCFSFVLWCVFARIKVEPMLALSISCIFFWPLEVTILFIESTMQNTETTISRFRFGIHFEMQHLYAFKWTISIPLSDHLWPATSNTHRPLPNVLAIKLIMFIPWMLKGLNVHPCTQFLRASSSLQSYSQTSSFMRYFVWRKCKYAHMWQWWSKYKSLCCASKGTFGMYWNHNLQ